MKENRIKIVSSGFSISFYLTMQEQTQKTRFLHVGHTRKSQIAVIIQTRWHSNTVFQFSATVYCNKLRTNEMHKSQKHTNNPRLHPKTIGFRKNKFYLLLFMLIKTTYCLLSSNRKKNALFCGLPIQSFVNCLLYCYYYRWLEIGI